MASRRKLKKQVKSMTELVANMCLLAEANAKENKEVFTELMYQALDLREDIVSRISHTEPGNVKVFYKRLYKDLAKGIEDIISKLYELEA